MINKRYNTVGEILILNRKMVEIHNIDTLWQKYLKHGDVKLDLWTKASHLSEVMLVTQFICDYGTGVSSVDKVVKNMTLILTQPKGIRTSIPTSNVMVLFPDTHWWYRISSVNSLNNCLSISSLLDLVFLIFLKYY